MCYTNLNRINQPNHINKNKRKNHMTNISTRRLGYGLIVLLLSSSSVYSAPPTSRKDIVVGGVAFGSGFAVGRVWGDSGVRKERDEFKEELERATLDLSVVRREKSILEREKDAVAGLAREFDLVKSGQLVESYVPVLTQALSHGRHRSGLYAELQTALLKEGEKAGEVDLLTRARVFRSCVDELNVIDDSLHEAWGKTTTRIDDAKPHIFFWESNTVNLVQDLSDAHAEKVKLLAGLDKLLRTKADGEEDFDLAERLKQLQDALEIHDADGGKELREQLQKSLSLVGEQTPLVETYNAVEALLRGTEEEGEIDIFGRVEGLKDQVMKLQGAVNEQVSLEIVHSAIDRLLRAEADGEGEINLAERLSVLQQLESAQGELIDRLQEEQETFDKALRGEDEEGEIDIADRLGWLKAEAGDLAAIQALLRSGEEDETEAVDLVDQLKEKAEGLVKQAGRYDEANGKFAEENAGLKRSLAKEKQSLEKEKGKYALLSLQYNALLAEREASDGEEEEDEYVGESEPYSGDDEGSGSEG